MQIKIIGWLLVALAAYYLLTNPDGAAGLVRVVIGWLQHVASSLSSFINDL